MITTAIRAVLVRELRALQREVAAYPDDELPWRLVPGISNPAGSLTLHLAGNLQHFVGAVLGGSGYLRDRDLEFSRRDVPRHELVAEVERTIGAVEVALEGAADALLAAEYPLPLAGRRVATGTFLMHLVSHLGYHLGQVDYHRRMLDPSAKAAGTLPLDQLPAIA